MVADDVDAGTTEADQVEASVPGDVGEESEVAHAGPPLGLAEVVQDEPRGAEGAVAAAPGHKDAERAEPWASSASSSRPPRHLPANRPRYAADSGSVSSAAAAGMREASATVKENSDLQKDEDLGSRPRKSDFTQAPEVPEPSAEPSAQTS
ncbi:hypothetical protein [Streptomyces koyangensis]|uniref:hypothetical protein n=1 Tax=Streptomyces koyangensis TaxID=188770 RepID=UPI003C2EE483